MAGPRLTAPKPLLSSRALSLVGAPAFSSPPASQQQQWQKVRLDGALEAQRRGPPPRDAGDADGGGGAAAVATATAAAAATSRSCPTMTNKTKYNHRNLQQRMRRILSWRSRISERRPPDIRATNGLQYMSYHLFPSAASCRVAFQIKPPRSRVWSRVGGERVTEEVDSRPTVRRFYCARRASSRKVLRKPVPKNCAMTVCVVAPGPCEVPAATMFGDVPFRGVSICLRS